MLFISMVNCFIVIALTSIMVFGVILVIRHQQSSVYRHFIVFMLLFWVLVMMGMLYGFYVDGFTVIPNVGVANMQILLLGMPCFFTLVSFPAAILNAELIKIRNWLLLTSPMLVMLVIYFAWHAISGDNPFVRYSAAELWQNIATPTVILRLMVVLLFVAYIVVIQCIIWQLVPVYNQYIKDHMADSSYNVDWVRTLVKLIMVVSVVYLTIIFSDILFLNTIYLVAEIVLFGYIIDRSLLYKTLNILPLLSVKWSHDRGWYLYDKSREIIHIKEAPPVGEELQKSMSNIKESINRWMMSRHAYTNIEFSIEDILAEFPDVTHNELTQMFKLTGDTFQSYVRRFRIKRACEIMSSKSRDKIYLKQLFGEVGFSHYSSFSRAFFAVTNQSPTDFLKNLQR